MSCAARNGIGSFPAHLRLEEAEVIDTLVTACLNRGLWITAYDEKDGPDFPLKASRDRAEIQREVAETDITNFLISDAEDDEVGWFRLTHGKRAHVVSGHSANDLCKEIREEVEPVVEKWVLRHEGSRSDEAASAGDSLS